MEFRSCIAYHDGDMISDVWRLQGFQAKLKVGQQDPTLSVDRFFGSERP